MYLVSSCLAGIRCRYDGESTENPQVMELVRSGRAVLVCPERLGGLLTPRPCCEIRITKGNEKRVVNKEGEDVTDAFVSGARKALRLARVFGIKKAILKSRSPSCGKGRIYDGTFEGRIVEGNGVLAQLLLEHGIQVETEDTITG